jgi:hypothetical protein
MLLPFRPAHGLKGVIDRGVRAQALLMAHKRAQLASCRNEGVELVG